MKSIVFVSINNKLIKKWIYIALLIALWSVFLIIAPKMASGRKEFPKTYQLSDTHIFERLGANFSPRIILEDRIRNIITSKAIESSIDPELLKRIAYCESGFQISVKNKNSTASGIFQFLDSTFISQAKAYGMEWSDKNSPEIQAELAAKIIADGGIKHWYASKNCWQ